MKTQWVKNQEDPATRAQKVSGKDTKGAPKGRGEDRTYTNERDPTTLKLHVPGIGKCENRREVYQAKVGPEMNNNHRYNQQNEQY